MKNLIAIFILTASVFALAEEEAVKLNSKFALDDDAFVKTAGNAIVEGEAFIALEDQTLKNCAGFNVELLPSAKYSDERILLTYGSNEFGQILLSQRPPKFTPDVPEYHEYLLKTSCNKEGKFVFKNVPEGVYYAIAFIIWEDNGSKRGGGVMKRVKVDAGTKKKIFLNGNKK